MIKKSKALIKREQKEKEAVARFKGTKASTPKKKRINRIDFFNQHAVKIGVSYAETKSQLKTAAKLKLPPMFVGYVVARLAPGVIKDKAILKWVEADTPVAEAATPGVSA